MRKLIIMILISSFFSAIAQKDSLATSKKQKKFIAVIQTNTGKYDRGMISQLEDSSILIKTLPGLKTNFSSGKKRNLTGSSSYAAENIETIKIQRYKAPKRGALIGAGVGLVVGAVIGLASGSDEIQPYPTEDFFGIGAFAVALNNAFAMTAGEKAVAYGFVGASSGAIVGVLVGALAKKKFIINGNRQKFEAMKLSVLERAYSK